MGSRDLADFLLSPAERRRLLAVYRTIHRRPELGFEERETARFVAKCLRGLGCRVATGVGKTGVVGIMGQGRRAVALRADLDALPVEERTGLSFASRRPGKMHACGHDLHIAIVLGAASVLARHKPPGRVKLIFQPCEEGPESGARAMIADGVLKNPTPRAIFGLHVDPTIATGLVGFRGGPLMARSDDFTLTILGTGGHAATPQTGVDAVTVAAEVVLALQTIVSRKSDPVRPSVVTVGKITGGTRSNVLADRVDLAGTFRSLSDAQAEETARWIRRVADGVTRAHNARFRFSRPKSYAVLENDPAMTDLARLCCRELFGRKSILELTDPIMGAEDFAFYLHRVPGAFLRLGIRNPRVGSVHDWHSPFFRVDERALDIGAPLLALCARRALLMP